jgi:recombinational DNA repair protein RecT
MVWQLDDDLWFPNPQWGEDDGLVAIGGDLSAERLLLAYSNGFFPWYAFQMERKPHWYCPLDRFVIFPNEIHISHSMKQLIKQDKYEVTFNQYFEGVIQCCSMAQDRIGQDGAWLGPDIIKAYTNLYSKGYAAKKGYTFWEKEFDSMAFKTMLRQLISKWGIMSIELQTAFEQDVITEDGNYLETEMPQLAPVTDDPEPQQDAVEPSDEESPPKEAPKRGRKKQVSLDDL